MVFPLAIIVMSISRLSYIVAADLEFFLRNISLQYTGYSLLFNQSQLVDIQSHKNRILVILTSLSRQIVLRQLRYRTHSTFLSFKRNTLLLGWIRSCHISFCKRISDRPFALFLSILHQPDIDSGFLLLSLHTMFTLHIIESSCASACPCFVPLLCSMLKS